MKIIDNHKDYYDYLQGIYGQDPLAVFDRRGSTYFKKDTLPLPLKAVPSGAEKGFIGTITLLCGLTCHKIYFENLPGEKITLEEFGSYRVTSRESKIPIRVAIHYYDYKPGETKTHMKYIIPSEMPGFPIRYPNGRICHEDVYFADGIRKSYFGWDCCFSNPILQSIPLMTVPPEQLFEQIHEFLLLLNEKKIEDTRSDVQKLESAGFDKKTSFRKM